MKRILGVIVMFVAALAQEKARFEEVSIKPGDPSATGSSTNSSPGRFTAVNVTLKRLITRAYAVEPYQIEGGPKWMESERFTIAAKLEDDAVKDRSREERQRILREALQNMLEERFQVTTHRESKTMPCFALVVAKGGAKLKEVEAQGGSSWNSNRGVMTANRMTMESFAAFLASVVERPVKDMTGLKASYELKLEWLPDSADVKAETSTAPSIYTAVQEQLGLKLESIKAPVEMLVIDRAEKPTEN